MANTCRAISLISPTQMNLSEPGATVEKISQQRRPHLGGPTPGNYVCVITHPQESIWRGTSRRVETSRWLCKADLADASTWDFLGNAAPSRWRHDTTWRGAAWRQSNGVNAVTRWPYGESHPCLNSLNKIQAYYRQKTSTFFHTR